MSGGRTRRTRFALGLGVALASLALFFVLLLVGLNPEPTTSLGADGYSVSGLGHSGLLALLEERGVPVLSSRWDSAARAREGTSLVIAEPDPDLTRVAGRKPLEDMVREARRVLLVAPKRLPGPAAPERPRWMQGQTPLAIDEVERVFEDWDLQLTRPAAGVEALDWQADERWPTPTLVDPPQLFEPYESLVPLISTSAGVLLGRLEMPRQDHVLLVLSDPDILANHGLVLGENAALALALIEELRGGQGGVVLDETWHGHLASNSAARLLLRPPLGYVTASLALLALLALWAGAVRFGGARPPAPLLKPGKAFLVENTADLLRAGGHSDHVLRRYFEAAERETSERLHAARAEPRAAREAVEALAHARGLPGPRALHDEVERAAEAGRNDARAIVAAGERIHRWKEELTHGRRRGS